MQVWLVVDRWRMFAHPHAENIDDKKWSKRDMNAETVRIQHQRLPQPYSVNRCQ